MGGERRIGGAAKVGNVVREDGREGLRAEVDVAERGVDEIGLAGIDAAGVASAGCLDHLLGSVDGRDPTVVEAFADEGDGDAVAAGDFEDAVAGQNVEGVDGPANPGGRPRRL